MAVTYSVPGTPRVYIDNFLLARTLGMKMNISNLRGVAESDDDEDYMYFDNDPAQSRLLWDMDPVRYNTINSPTYDIIKLHTEFWTDDNDKPNMVAFLNLMHTSNYAAVLNHNLFSGSDQPVKVDLHYNGTAEDGGVPGTTAIVGDFGQEITEDGFIISEISLDGSDNGQLDQFDFIIAPSDDAIMASEFQYKIGCFSVGTYLDFPYAPNLEVKMTYSHEGVQSKRTIAGKDLTHVSYSGAPNWGDLPPFTTTDQYNTGINFEGAGLTGRKSWDMKFSYVDKTDMFNAVQSGSSAGIYTTGGFEETSSIIGTYLSRTLGGKLKHILQPDNTKKEFYMVKLDQKSTSITQVSPGVFDISFKFVQVW